MHCDANREMRLTVLSAASRARQHASTNTTRHKVIHAPPETLSTDEKLHSSSSSLPAAMMMAGMQDGGDACRTTAAATLADNEVASLATTPQPIRSQYDDSGHVDDVSLAETPSSECVHYSVQRHCPRTDDALVAHSTE